VISKKNPLSQNEQTDVVHTCINCEMVFFL
jgi:hypothetical protein